MELNLIGLARSPILCRKIFPNQLRILHDLSDENPVKILTSRQSESPRLQMVFPPRI
jgi:hypothetical protein